MSVNNIENVFLGNRLLHFQRFVERQQAKCSRMFTYTNLPDDFDVASFELDLQSNGVLYVKKSGDSLDWQTDKNVNDVNTLVEVPSDTVRQGILPIIQEHALLDGQLTLTLWRALINLRTNYIIETKDENTAQSARMFEEQLAEGRLAILATDSPLAGLEGVEVHNTQTVTGLADQIVTIGQFITAKYYGELGISVNGDVKRQYVNEEQVRSNSGQPLIWDMLQCRKEAFEVINELFGFNIEVELSDTWDETVEKINEVEEDDVEARDDDLGDSATGTDESDEQDEQEDETDEVEESER